MKLFKDFGNDWSERQSTPSPKKLRDSFVGPFIIIKLHGKNAVEVELTGEYSRKHSTFPISLIKPYQVKDNQKFPTAFPQKIVIPPFDEDTPLVIKKVLKERITRVNGKDLREYLVQYHKQSSDKDKWLHESDISESATLLRKYRLEKRSSS
ncbi:hypothetical protein BY996DRAFT_8412278 [Phakopsora pachyrhizi]|nr:hypothetical protein BY996DRAFT_8412278 [Phakopsora pachyrhizi]